MNVDYRTPYPNELYHHGIKGQKWGVRRFQNENGSLTTAGKKRYSTGDLSDKKSTVRAVGVKEDPTTILPRPMMEARFQNNKDYEDLSEKDRRDLMRSEQGKNILANKEFKRTLRSKEYKQKLKEDKKKAVNRLEKREIINEHQMRAAIKAANKVKDVPMSEAIKIKRNRDILIGANIAISTASILDTAYRDIKEQNEKRR